MIASDVGQWALDVVSTADGKARRCRGLQTAIDVFFRLLAADRQKKAIGIIRSGTSSHGTLGLKEIKLVGGMVMVQDPQTADYDQTRQIRCATVPEACATGSRCGRPVRLAQPDSGGVASPHEI